MRALIYKSKGDLGAALADLDVAIGLDADPSYYRQRGSVQLKRKEYQKAIDDFTQAIQLSPTDFWTYDRRGLALLDTHNYDAAIRDFTEAIRLKPDSGISYLNRGFAYENRGDREKAQEDYALAEQFGWDLERIKAIGANKPWDQIQPDEQIRAADGY